LARSDGIQHDHVRLLAGENARGEPVYEEVPARLRHEDLVEVLGTPALALGCAAGDTIDVQADGTFAVITRGGNVSVLVYAAVALSTTALSDLRSALLPLGAVVEVPPARKIAVATIPVRAGFEAIEAAMKDWITGREGVEWFYGNVYDGGGEPLRWWEAEGRPGT
jgi:hypothetical protein